MTKIKEQSLKIRRYMKKRALIITILTLIFLTVFLSDEIKTYAEKGLILCAESIIPTLFPFMIFSDLILSFSSTNEENTASRIFKKIFGLNPACIVPFICGILCGFPVGAVCVKNLYNGGIIDKNDAEFLLGICATPSLAFIVSGVGAGMMGSSKYGFFLWLSVIFAAMITGLIFREKEYKFKNSKEIKRQKFDFVESVRSSGYTMISICSFIIFFSIVIGLLGEVIKNDYIHALFSSVFEIGNASSLIADSKLFSNELKLIFLGFALGFSGISVYMQTVSIVSESKLSCKTYLKMKLIQGLISALLFSVFALLF